MRISLTNSARNALGITEFLITNHHMTRGISTIPELTLIIPY